MKKTIFTPIPPIPQDVSTIIQRIRDSKSEFEFMKTGWPHVDAWLDGGFFRKEFIVIGGSTGVGKSYCASQLLYNIAKQGFKCAYFSLEISNEMIVSRMVGSIANIKPTRIRLGLLTPQEFIERTQSEADIESLKDFLFFYDTTYFLEEINAEIVSQGYEFILIDFIQNVITTGESEHVRLTSISSTFAKIAKETNSTILGLSQLSNFIAREGSKSKNLEYKGSGNIGILCDLGFFIERESSEWNAQSDNKLIFTLHKNRRGGSGVQFSLAFKVPGGKIYEP